MLQQQSQSPLHLHASYIRPFITPIPTLRKNTKPTPQTRVRRQTDDMVWRRIQRAIIQRTKVPLRGWAEAGSCDVVGGVDRGVGVDEAVEGAAAVDAVDGIGRERGEGESGVDVGLGEWARMKVGR